MEIPKSRQFAGLTHQLIAVIVVSLGMMTAGMMQGWMSPMTKVLTADDSPVGRMSSSELGLVASLSSYLKFFVGILTSEMANRLGRKYTLIICAVPTIIGGLLIVIANNKWLLYVGRCLTGFALVGVSLGPTYLSETVHESIRGTLMTFANLSITVGLLTTYSSFKFLGYRAVNYILTAVPTIYFATFFFLPETPYYLVNKSRDKAAFKSLKWFRGGNEEVTNAEIKAIEVGSTGEMPSVFQSFKTKEARSALMIGVTLFALQTSSGIHIVLNYAEMIFTETQSPLKADNAAILSAVAILIATLVCLVLVDKVGRKPLLYFSLVFGFISHLSITVIMYLVVKGHTFSNVGTFTVILLTLFVFTYGCGLGAVPAVVLNEVASVEIKSYVATIAVIVVSLFLIVILQVFPMLTESVGIYANFIFPAISNLLGIFFVKYCVPETKGKSLNEITKLLKGS